MRVITVVLGGLLVATVASADVRLTIKRDGRKVIDNVGDSRAGRGSNLNWLARQHDRSSKYDPLIEHYSNRYGVNPTLVRAVIQVESNFNPSCVSTKGARGLMQLMPGTAKRFGVTSVHDPEQNIRGGVRYLSILLEMFNGDLPRALAAYNAGENAVLRYGGTPPYEETIEYVRRAMTVYYGRPYGGMITFSGRRGGKKLRGGYDSAALQPVAAAMMPGSKVLGHH